MDTHLLHLGVLSISITFLAFAFFGWKLSGHPKRQNRLLPPGRTGWPIIGEMWEFIVAKRRGTPYKFFTDRMVKYSPKVFKTRLLGNDMVVFCGPEGNKFLFSNDNKGITVWAPESFKKLFASPEDRADFGQVAESKLRACIVEFTKTEHLREYVSIMDSLTQQHVEKNWSWRELVKVQSLVRMHTFAITCKFFLNASDAASIKRLEDPFLMLLKGIRSIPIDFPGTPFRRAMKASETIREELVRIIKERRKDLEAARNDADDDIRAVNMLTRLLLQQKDSGDDHVCDVDDMRLAYEFLSFLVVSHASTSYVITLIIYHLEKYPHVYERVFQEQMEISKSKSSSKELLNWGDIQKMKYTWWVAYEVMRLLPSTAIFRELTVDLQFSGFTIPKGWKAWWSNGTTHKNPDYFPDPEKFDPSRFEGAGPPPYSFAPFGGGPRMCPGREFARLEILTYIHNVVTKFKFKNVNPDEKIIHNPSPAPANGLCVQLTPIN